MKIRPLYKAYLCNAAVIAMLLESSGWIMAGMGLLLLSATVTYCQLEWDKKNEQSS